VLGSRGAAYQWRVNAHLAGERCTNNTAAARNRRRNAARQWCRWRTTAYLIFCIVGVLASVFFAARWRCAARCGVSRRGMRGMARVNGIAANVAAHQPPAFPAADKRNNNQQLSAANRLLDAARAWLRRRTRSMYAGGDTCRVAACRSRRRAGDSAYRCDTCMPSGCFARRRVDVDGNARRAASSLARGAGKAPHARARRAVRQGAYPALGAPTWRRRGGERWAARAAGVAACGW
jgi:hypothetical protein